MRYQLFGKSGLRVSTLCLGTMGFMDGLSWGTSQAESRVIYDAFLEGGGNFIDTANTYGDGASERFLGEFMARERERVVLTTKYTGRYIGGRPDRDVNQGGSHRKNMMSSVAGSLKRLRSDYIDLLWVHAWDFLTPAEEVLRGLDDLVRSGKVLYIGVSNVPAWIAARANTLAELKGWTSFIGLQIEYNLVERDAVRELLPMARALDIGVTAWTPLASGWLTGKYLGTDGESGSGGGSGAPRRLDDPMMGRFLKRTERNRLIAEQVVRVAREAGCTPAQVALNWLRQRGIIPIFGARTKRQVEENLSCLDYCLSDEQLRSLDEVGKIQLGYPHDFLASGIVKKFLYSGMLELIDARRG
jgi:aryl-alcohol dehydrogenase-like predicted oxidoreductase